MKILYPAFANVPHFDVDETFRMRQNQQMKTMDYNPNSKAWLRSTSTAQLKEWRDDSQKAEGTGGESWSNDTKRLIARELRRRDRRVRKPKPEKERPYGRRRVELID